MAVAVTPSFQSAGGRVVEAAAAVWNAEDRHPDLSELLVLHQGIAVADLGTIAGPEGDDVRCALQLSSSPRERRQAIAALSVVPGLSNVVGIEAPVAIFASQWHKNPAAAPEQPLRIIGYQNDRICSILVAHTGQRRILSIGIVESAADIKELILRAVRASEPEQLEPTEDSGTPWSVTMKEIETVLAVGVDSHYTREFQQLFGQLMTVGDSAHAVLYGLTRVEALADWTATWPTTRVHLGDGWTRQPGPLRETIEEHITRVRPAASLRFSYGAGRDIPLRAGSVVAKSCVLPDRLGIQPRLRLIDDGRLLVIGPPGTRPLAIELAWPIPGSHRTPCIEIRSASDLGVELTDPWIPEMVTADQPTKMLASVPKNLSDVDPELGRHS